MIFARKEAEKRIAEAITGERLHEYYLEATKTLNPKSYNPNAQKKFKDLTKEQQQIDIFIANKLKSEVCNQNEKEDTT